jgi:hypothetical protein
VVSVFLLLETFVKFNTSSHINICNEIPCMFDAAV